MSTHTRHDADGEYELVTIDEWKKRYGTPGDGTGLDINGRILGYFATEPDFCEDTEAAA